MITESKKFIFVLTSSKFDELKIVNNEPLFTGFKSFKNININGRTKLSDATLKNEK